METKEEKLQRLQIEELERKSATRKIFFVLLGLLALVLIIMGLSR